MTEDYRIVVLDDEHRRLQVLGDIEDVFRGHRPLKMPNDYKIAIQVQKNGAWVIDREL